MKKIGYILIIFISLFIFSGVVKAEKKYYGCSQIVDKNTCKSNKQFACVWVDRTTGKITENTANAYCNVDNLQYIKCGNAFDIPSYLPKITSFFINLLKIATPIILIFTSAVSLVMAITASKEDEMTKAKATLIRRIIIAAIIFFTISITQFVISKVADGKEFGEMQDCFDCFINNSCSKNKYYKNNIAGRYSCFTADASVPMAECH